MKSTRSRNRDQANLQAYSDFVAIPGYIIRVVGIGSSYKLLDRNGFLLSFESPGPSPWRLMHEARRTISSRDLAEKRKMRDRRR
jgi:hypothetical protein